MKGSFGQGQEQKARPEFESRVHSDRSQSRKHNQSPNQGFIETGVRAESATRVRMKGGFRQHWARKQALSPNKRLIRTGATQKAKNESK